MTALTQTSRLLRRVTARLKPAEVMRRELSSSEGVQSSTRKIKVVSFDVTGTLIQYVGALGFYFGRALKRHTGISDLQGKNLDLGFKKAYAATKLQWPNFGAKSGMATIDWWRHVVMGTFEEALALQSLKRRERNELEPVFREIYHVFETTEPYAVYADVIPTLEQLKSEGYRIAIISNTDERYRDVLQGLGVYSFIDYPILSREVAMEKPSEEVYRLLLKQAAVEAEEVVHIGDSYTNDYMGPRRIGMHSLRCFRHGLGQSQGPEEVTNMEEIRSWLEEGRRRGEATSSRLHAAQSYR